MGENKEILKRIQDSAVDPLIRRLAKRQVVLRGAGKREREGGGKGRKVKRKERRVNYPSVLHACCDPVTGERVGELGYR